MEPEGLIDMKSIPIDKRPNISFEDMDKYKNGGLTVESLEPNGALVYIPYGIYVDLFRAMENSMLLLHNNIDNTNISAKKLISEIMYEEMVRNKKHYDEINNVLFVQLIESQNKKVVQECNKSIKIFENIYPIINEV